MTEVIPLISSRWADEIEDEDETIVDKPKDGERMVTEIVIDEETGKKLKIIRTFKLEKKLVSKGVIERRKWAKFGASAKDPPGPKHSTTVVGDPVQMAFLGEKEAEPLDVLNKDKQVFVKCRFCQENHFSARCPYKEAGIPSEYLLGKETTEEKKTGVADSEVKSNIFLPPALRGGNRRGESMTTNARKDDTTIRISNLPESMTEQDMQDLCKAFAPNETKGVERIFLAKDRTTNVCKGFAFVTFSQREYAARALKALHGYGYDHLILNAEWSKPTN